ncbi:hypothetical protein SAMN02745245_01061 [Anaerosphaera aminiphila DSM 21120]|uniref:Uncharacterized protein n=1 Tax=Anaerosphaera aminiphila DSM 21120 TaxID=1120995 RepID=A0A1M5RZN5_9FIRM|nr:hypothetical protein [Anaerosphaera aminiphila]SHH31670.1 hypothetical protein SAMN02745245_01061 [Anaerosphaera aminiphila DSM 21120]
MGKKIKKTAKRVNLDKVTLTEEEEVIAKKKAIFTIALCIMWPITLLLLWPSLRNFVPNIVYYGIIGISMINIILTYLYTTVQIEQIKYQAYLSRNSIGKIERFGSVFVIVEAALILIFIILS